MLKKLLIANRGEIARRIIRTARKMGVKTVAVYSDADRRALHVAEADEAVHIGGSPATESYLRIEKIIAAAKQTGADAVHPGYGFLSENADLPEACVKAGITFVGPRAEAMRALGGKAAAKEIAIKAGVPVVPGYQGSKQDAASLAAEAKKIGYPVMIKAVAGGGGRGMRLVDKEADLKELLESARREAQSAFGNPDVLIEKVVVAPRHIEVQVFGDSKGNVVHLFERDCTLQRRNQKVIEEAPAPGMSAALRAKICDAAVKLAKSVKYEGAGTVEFLVEGGSLAADARWYFIEMNTRLQVEHPVTEEITGLDLVAWQLRVAAGEPLPLKQDAIAMAGHAVEVRLCAEDPAKGFLPSIGRIAAINDDAFEMDEQVRIESGVAAGSVISPFYDSMIAKVITRGHNRDEALTLNAATLRALTVYGVKTNAPFLLALLEDARFRAGTVDTGYIGRTPALLGNAAIDPQMVIFAADALFAVPGGHGGPWDQSDGFQLGGSLRTVSKLVVDDQPFDVASVWVNGRPQRSLGGVAHDPGFDAAWPGTLSHRDRDTLYVWRDGVHLTAQRLVYDASAHEDVGDGSVVRAPINGRVAKVFVAKGETVEKGARIAVVEAMKMEHVLTATIAGTIEKVAATEGAQVTQGALLASITPA